MSFIRYVLCKYFIPTCAFILLSFADKFSILMKSNLPIFSFMDHAFGLLSKTHCQTQSHLDFLLYYILTWLEMFGFFIPFHSITFYFILEVSGPFILVFLTLAITFPNPLFFWHQFSSFSGNHLPESVKAHKFFSFLMSLVSPLYSLTFG